MDAIWPGIELPVVVLIRAGERFVLIAQGLPPKVCGGVQVPAFAIDNESRQLTSMHDGSPVRCLTDLRIAHVAPCCIMRLLCDQKENVPL
jgi:hypothetical protein